MENNVKTKKRNPWLAAFFNLLGPGFGYFYLGRLNRFWLIFIPSIIIWGIYFHGLGGLLNTPWIFIFIISLGLGLQLFAFFDGYKIARSSENYILQWYNKIPIYFGIATSIIGLSFLVESIAAGELFPENAAVKSYKAASTSMWPSLKPQERFFADMRHYETNAPKRGELAIFSYPANPDYDYIKRIIAISGDRLSVIDGKVVLNGIPVRTTPDGNLFNANINSEMNIVTETMDNGISYKIVQSNPKFPGANFEEVLIPENHFFVMGDNRDNSNDSRFTIGFVPYENLKGRATFIYWPEEWSRFGVILNN